MEWQKLIFHRKLPNYKSLQKLSTKGVQKYKDTTRCRNSAHFHWLALILRVMPTNTIPNAVPKILTNPDQLNPNPKCWSALWIFLFQLNLGLRKTDILLSVFYEI